MPLRNKFIEEIPSGQMEEFQSSWAVDHGICCHALAR